jgi:hypothetical protein
VTSTSAASFSDNASRTLLLYLDADGWILSASIRARTQKTGEKGKATLLNVVMKKTEEARAPVLNKPVVLNEQGKAEGEVKDERTFLQK